MKFLWFLFLLYPLGGFILSFLIILNLKDPILWIPLFLSSPLFFISLWVLLNVFILRRPLCTCDGPGGLLGLELSLCGEHTGGVSTLDGLSINSDVPIDRMVIHTNIKGRPAPAPTQDELQPMWKERS